MTKLYYLLQTLCLLLLFMPLNTNAQLSNEFKSALTNYRTTNFNFAEVITQLDNAPMRGNLIQNRSSRSVISLPMPDGLDQSFQVVESPLISEELAAAKPYLKSYIVQGIDDPTKSGRINVTTDGLHGIVRGSEGVAIIEPIKNARGVESYVSYYDHDIINQNELDEYCGMENDLVNLGHGDQSAAMMRTNSCFQNGAQLRNYEIVLTCSGEFYQLNGNTDAGAEAALLNRMMQVSMFYEQEMAITFTIVEFLLNSDPTTDPFSDPTNTLQSLNEGSTYINNNVTVSSWDLGHSFHEITCNGSCGWAGIAGVGVVCTSSKARGYTYLPNNIPSNISVMLHEFGHMFSCYHTNYGCGNTGCQRYEPGQGVSLMSTSAGCSQADDYANREDYLHVGSMQAILNFVTTGAVQSSSSCNTFTPGSWSDCAEIISTGNTPPTSDANAFNINGLTIPKGTPFELTGSGSDPDGNFSLTYSWEQYDTDVNTSVLPANAGDETDAPLFRSFPPSSDPTRICPQLSSVLDGNNTADTGEDLPEIARTMNWRLTVRDNIAGGGGIACDEISINVGADGPFRITSQNAITSWSAGSAQTVTWDVANTDAAQYTCANVDVLFSVDGGNSFNIVLASNVANDGSQNITAPLTNTNAGRIKIVCSNNSNIFFDINDMDIAIADGCSANAGTIANPDPVFAGAGDADLNLSLCVGLPINSWSGELNNLDPTMNVTTKNISNDNCQSFNSNNPVYEALQFCVSTAGDYSITRSSNGGFFNILNLYEAPFSDNNECNNWINSTALYDPSTNLVSSSASISGNLNVGTTYTLVSSAFNNSVPSDGTFTVGFSTTVYEVTGINSNGFDYTFLIVNQDDGRIAGFSATADLSDDQVFDEGEFAVYGLSFPGGTNLNTYLNTSFASFQALINSGSLCADLTSNSVSVIIDAGLPVELIDFNGRPVQDGISLNWQTATEINSDYFTLEKSIDGINFFEIGTIPAAGTTNTNQFYDFLDRQPKTGQNYYRLKQYDLDGSLDIMNKIVVVNYDGASSISVRPNPVKGAELIIDYEGSGLSPVLFEIFNMNGQIVRNVEFEDSERTDNFTLNVADLSEGVYILRVQQNQEVKSIRFVKTQ